MTGTHTLWSTLESAAVERWCQSPLLWWSPQGSLQLHLIAAVVDRFLYTCFDCDSAAVTSAFWKMLVLYHRLSLGRGRIKVGVTCAAALGSFLKYARWKQTRIFRKLSGTVFLTEFGLGLQWAGPDGREVQSLGPYLSSVLWHCWLGHLTRRNLYPIWPLMCVVGRKTLLYLSTEFGLGRPLSLPCGVGSLPPNAEASSGPSVQPRDQKVTETSKRVAQCSCI